MKYRVLSVAALIYGWADAVDLANLVSANEDGSAETPRPTLEDQALLEDAGQVGRTVPVSRRGRWEAVWRLRARR